MSSRGFEFAYMLDGSNATPVIRDFPLLKMTTTVGGTTTGYVIGQPMVISGTAGSAVNVKATGGTTILGVMMESNASVASNGAESGKIALVTPGQVWRVSMTGTTLGSLQKYVPTTSASWGGNATKLKSATTGVMCLMVVDTGSDDEGNVLAYVQFSKTMVGGSWL